MEPKANASGDETVSLEEFVHFYEKEGVPRSSAEMMFFQADIDGKGMQLPEHLPLNLRLCPLSTRKR